MTSSLIERLVEHRGIESNFTDAWGKPAQVNEATKRQLLKAMGYEVDDNTVLERQLDSQFSEDWLTPLNPVQVNRSDDELFLTVRLPIELVNDKHVLFVKTEQGQEIKQGFIPSNGELINVCHIQDIEFQEYLVRLETSLPLGYHDLLLLAEDGDEIASMRMIIAPRSCYQPPKIVAGNKAWGLSVQLYCLRSEKNWGVGDFSDLAFLIENAAKQGAQFVGLNPIHALYPANPNACSPYGPSSRRWLNFIYIDVTALEGYDSEAVQAIVQDAEFKSSIDYVRNVDYVDYEAVTRL
jgi:4-alpha-glucanotransferase